MAPRGPEDVRRWLDAHGFEARMHEDLPRVHTVREAAEALGVPVAAVAKTVVFDHDGAPLAVLAPGDAKVRDRLVAAYLDTPRNALRMARPEQVLAWTGYPVGGVPPVAHVSRMRILMDERLLALERVVFGGGSDKALLELAPRALRDELDPDVGVFSEPVES